MFLSECCDAVPFGTLDDWGGEPMGLCSACKEHATFYDPEEDEMEDLTKENAEIVADLLAALHDTLVSMESTAVVYRFSKKLMPSYFAVMDKARAAIEKAVG